MAGVTTPNERARTTPMPDQRPAGSVRLRGGARVALLDAALRVIRARGLHATTVDELCEAAGVTKGAFFHHFASTDT